MTQLWLDRMGDWNPQLFRELKGRFRLRNLLLTGASSLVGQLLVGVYFLGKLPSNLTATNRYCTGTPEYSEYFHCLKDASGSVLMNWQLWNLDLFLCLGLFSTFILVVGGIYLLVSDLEQEERRGTLNFIRLTPQPSANLLVGKLLGVPILVYLAALLAVPLHWHAGLMAQIAPGLILSFYGMLAVGCACFYSAALLYSVTTAWLGGFQPWLASGSSLLFLAAIGSKSINAQPLDWLNLFSPTTLLSYLVPEQLLVSSRILGSSADYSLSHLRSLTWFSLPVGAQFAGMVVLMLVNYGFCMFWLWQALRRCFRNPNVTMLSKRQSYGLVLCFEVLILGFTKGTTSWFHTSLGQLLFLNLALFLVLIAALSPQRQTLQDWSRFRREWGGNRKQRGYASLLNELVWGDKSPALVAIGLNLVVATILLSSWVLTTDYADQPAAILSIGLSLGIIWVYAAIAQLLLFMKTDKRTVWTAGTLFAAIVLPILSLTILSLEPDQAPILWLFSAFPWNTLEHLSLMSAMLGVLGQVCAVSLLSLQLTRRLQQAGASASQALLTSRPALPTRDLA